MPTRRLVRLAAVLLIVVAGLCSIAQAGPLAPQSSPAASPAAAGSCSLPAFLLAAPGPAAIQTNLICGCGDSLCNGQLVGVSCGSSRICLSTGFCSSPGFRRCICTTPGT